MTRHVLCPVLCLFAAVVGSGCAEPPASVGSIAVALSAPGPNGSTYHLPPAVLLLDNPGYHGTFSLDGDAPSTTFDVPAGDYAVSAFELAGGGDVWPLTREDPDGSTTTVQATLDLPPTISVAEGATTGLLIEFHVPSLPPITFSMGSVDVSVFVDGAHASSIDFTLSASAMLVSSLGFGNGPAVLPSRLPAFQSTGDGYELHAHITGPWSITSPSEVCAPAFATASATGSSGFVNLVAEAPTTDRFCIDRGDHVTLIQVMFRREGGGITPLLSDLSGPRPLLINHFAGAILEDGDVFDGRVLRLDRIVGTKPAGVFMSGEVGEEVAALPDGTPLTSRWVSLEEFANGTLTLSAQ